jgi:transcriptional regulator with XRE-family HTH domain
MGNPRDGVVDMDSREFASRAGVSEATVSRIRNGHRRPSIELMGKIQDLLCWPIGEQAISILDGAFADQFRSRLERIQ